jgi:hypothetical protein
MGISRALREINYIKPMLLQKSCQPASGSQGVFVPHVSPAMDTKLPVQGTHSTLPSLYKGPNHNLRPPIHKGRLGECVRPLLDTQGATPPMPTVAKETDWTSEEDSDLLKLRRRRKPWNQISTVMKRRSAYSCQQRYHNIKKKKRLVYVYCPLVNRPP